VTSRTTQIFGDGSGARNEIRLRDYGPQDFEAIVALDQECF